MKKILFIAYYYPPIKSGGSQRVINFIKYMRLNNFEVTLLTSSYKYSEFKTDIIRIFDLSFNMNRKGIKKIIWFILRIYTEFINKFGQYHSIYSWWKNNVKRNSEKIIKSVKPDIILVTYPPVETLELGLFFSNKFNIPMISDFRDGLLFESIEEKKLTKLKIINSYYKGLERNVIMNSSYVLTVSDPITNYFKTRYKLENVQTVYTGFDKDEIKYLQNKSEYFENNKFNIVFTGRLNLSDSSNKTGDFFNAVSDLIKDEGSLKNKIKIHLAGEFTKEESDSFSNLVNIGVIENLGFLSRQESLVLQRKSDLLLIITSIERSSIVTSKIFEYLMAEKPILAMTYGTELEKIIKLTKTGWVIHPHDYKGIKTLLQRVITDKNFYNQLKPDKKMIDSMSTKEQIEKLKNII